MPSHLPGDRSEASGATASTHAGPISRIDPSSSINDVLLQYPATIAVFNAYGVDACCGGAQSVRDAAAQDGLDLEALVAALDVAAGGAS